MPRLRLHITTGDEISAIRNTLSDLATAISLLTRDVQHIGRQVERLAFVTFRTQGAVMADLDDIQSAVEQNGEVTASAVALIEGLADRLDDIDTTDPAVTALADELRAQSAALAAAVVANTPADESGGGGEGGDVEPAEPGTDEV